MPAENPHLELDRLLIGDIYTSRAVMDVLEVLCDECGSRFAGTAGERQAADFMAATFEGCGLAEVRLEEFDYAGWTRGEAVLEIVEPVARRLDCISLPYCPAGEVEAELVSAGCGSPPEYEQLGDGAKGRLVLAFSESPPGLGRWVHRQEKYGRAVLGGAAGFVFVSEASGVGPETGSLQDDKEAPIPGISVCREDGEYLKRLLARHGKVQLRLKTTDVNTPRTSWNVVAELPGTERADEAIVLGCHYDGHDISQGAVDPASGMAVVLEAARVLGQHAAGRLARTVRFIAYGCEEIGLTGSYEYVEAHADEMDRVRFVLNLDAAGGSGRKGVVLNGWPQLEGFFRAASAEMAYPMPIGQGVNSYSDHFPFFLAGVPSGGMGDAEARPSGRGFGHTRYDTLDKVQLGDLREASGVAARLAVRLAQAADLPRRRAAREVAQVAAESVNMEGHRVALELAGRLGSGEEGRWVKAARRAGL